MNGTILITGGAGFIGSHLADLLLEKGYRVRCLDSLSPQVHGSDKRRPQYLARDVELMIGDITDRRAVKSALEGVTAVFHFAAKVGVGQSMYDIADYTKVNNLGTAVLLEELVKHPVGKLVVASSMSIYGEGMYEDADGRPATANLRGLDQLKCKDWEPRGHDGRPLTPVATDETKQPDLSSTYALSKYDQERMCLITGRAYGIPTTALRFFNVYGTRQALSNPYTGVLAIFSSLLLRGKSPRIFEDGLQCRDFVHVSDIARACLLALQGDAADGEVFNIGSGEKFTILEVALRLAKLMGRDIRPQVTRNYRLGDIRHCHADITKARRLLNYHPQVDFDTGLLELVQWLENQIVPESISSAEAELNQKELTV